MEFTPRDVLNEEQDSDVDPATGWTDLRQRLLLASERGRWLDTGKRACSCIHSASRQSGTGAVRTVGICRHPVVLSRILPDLCVCFAEVLVELPKCAFVFHDIQGGGYMLDINEMMEDTKANRSTDQPIDYSSNVCI